MVVSTPRAVPRDQERPPAETVAFFRAAASHLHRADPRCPVHRIAHTGKLARAIVLDLALLDWTGEESFWHRAVTRAGWVASRLAPDPDHGALIFLPGRLDARNCSNSVIDSGECTDALARLLLHPRAALLDDGTRARLHGAVAGNADTYLRAAVDEKGITNQRLWGAMGLATAHALDPHTAWRDALGRSLERSLLDQRADGSWGYQPGARLEGAHPGAADVTVYYHSRCLTFLLSVVARVPELGTPAVERALGRGLDFLNLVITPDGLKPLGLEGKRWFWEGSYEAGSAAYDLFALLRGAERLDRPELRSLAGAVWRQLVRHQAPGGSIRACMEAGNADFVCPDFHTADLAWTAQVADLLPAAPVRDPDAYPSAGRPANSVRLAGQAGVVRLEGRDRVALVRTGKLPSNTQFGGAAGGGSLIAVTDSSGRRLFGPSEAVWTLRARPAARPAVAGVLRFLRENPPRREGRQWLFVARLLFAAGRPGAALRRLWCGYVFPLLSAWRDTATSAWTCTTDVVEEPGAVACSGRPARADGSVPDWASGLVVARSYSVEANRLAVSERLAGVAHRGVVVEYSVPSAATAVQADGDGIVLGFARGAIRGRTGRDAFRAVVTYSL